MFNRFFRRSKQPTTLGSVTAKVDDVGGYAGAGWTALTGRPHDYDPARVLEIYQDALTAWRKNPIAWRIIAITTDYVVGDQIKISGLRRDVQKFIDAFWDHPKNRMDLRLESMSDELARAGDLFVLLFRNPADGQSYIRFVTKDRIQKIETAPNDWETELVYFENQDSAEPKQWLSPSHPDSPSAEAVMLHYSVNRPVGALLGESDLVTMIPWLQRYSRMLEDRVRLNWAIRAFLWIVTVPTNKVAEKQEQYRSAPESGSIIVKDTSETWESVSPMLRGADAQHDLKAIRQMVDAGSGYPPHWRGESADANLATATAMQSPTERHLARRQKYFVYMLQDIIYTAFQRAAQLGYGRTLTIDDYSRLFSVSMPDVSRSDNEALARASKDLAETFRALAGEIAAVRSPTLAKILMRLVFKFAGEPQDDETLSKILEETPKNADDGRPTNDEGKNSGDIADPGKPGNGVTPNGGGAVEYNGSGKENQANEQKEGSGNSNPSAGKKAPGAGD